MHVMTGSGTAVAVYREHSEAQSAIQALRNGCFQVADSATSGARVQPLTSAAFVLAGKIGTDLADLGIPEQSLLAYANAVAAGKYLVVAHGSREEAQRAKHILTHAGFATPDMHLLV